LLLVLICTVVAGVGAWTDKPSVAVEAKPTVMTKTKSWDALVEISRHGRRLDGFRPTITIVGPGNSETLDAKAVSAGKYRVSVVFPQPGYYTYTVKVANRIAARGSVYAIPN
jgi:hypothetical protein